MSAKILKFAKPKTPDYQVTIGECVALADLIHEDRLMKNVRHFLDQAEAKIADGEVGVATGAMIVCARLLHREIFQVRQTPQDCDHVLFTGAPAPKAL